MSLKKFEKKRIGGIGLWYQKSEKTYVSEPLNLSNLKEFKGNCRFIIYKNRWHQKNDNRPDHVLYIYDTESANKKVFDIEDENSEFKYTKEEVKKCIDDATRDALNGYTDNIVADYIDER